MSHLCAIQKCGKKLSVHHLMCLEHWSMAPAELRAKVNTTWSSYLDVRRPGATLSGEEVDNYRAKLSACREVRQQAIAAVQSQLIPSPQSLGAPPDG